MACSSTQHTSTHRARTAPAVSEREHQRRASERASEVAAREELRAVAWQ
jgi:hypothetical protein